MSRLNLNSLFSRWFKWKQRPRIVVCVFQLHSTHISYLVVIWLTLHNVQRRQNKRWQEVGVEGSMKRWSRDDPLSSPMTMSRLNSKWVTAFDKYWIFHAATIAILIAFVNKFYHPFFDLMSDFDNRRSFGSTPPNFNNHVLKPRIHGIFYSLKSS